LGEKYLYQTGNKEGFTDENLLWRLKQQNTWWQWHERVLYLITEETNRRRKTKKQWSRTGALEENKCNSKYQNSHDDGEKQHVKKCFRQSFAWDICFQ